MYEINQWTEVRSIPDISSGSRGRVFTMLLDFSPDGKALVIGRVSPNHLQPNRLQVIDLASGNKNLDIPLDPNFRGSVAWSPNGSMFANGSPKGPIGLWEASSGKPLGELEGHTSYVSTLIFSADGGRLYSAGGDQTIRIWDVGEQRLLATLRGSRGGISGLALAPDGNMLASAGQDGVVAFWSALPRPEERLPGVIELGQFANPRRTPSFRRAFAPDSRVLAAPRAGIVSLFDLATCKEIEQIRELGTNVQRVHYSPDGTLLVSGEGGPLRGRMHVWSFAERRILKEWVGDPNAFEAFVPDGFRADGTRLLVYHAIRFRVDGTGLFSRPREEMIWLDTRTWQPVHTYTLPAGALGRGLSRDGRFLACGLKETLDWLNAETGELLAAPPLIHRLPVSDMAFSQDGSRAASIGQDGTVAIWDTSSFESIPAFEGRTMRPTGVAFSPDGRRLATCTADGVTLWDLSTQRELVTFSGQGSPFFFAAFSPNGQWLAACDHDGTLHLWRAPSLEEIEAAEKQEGSHGGNGVR